MKWNDLEGGSHGLSEVLNRYRGTCKSTVTLRHGGQCPGQVFNWAPPEWKSKSFPIQ